MLWPFVASQVRTGELRKDCKGGIENDVKSWNRGLLKYLSILTWFKNPWHQIGTVETQYALDLMWTTGSGRKRAVERWKGRRIL